MSTTCHYPTDVSDAQWEVLQLVLPPPTWRPGSPGRKPMDLRRGIHGLFSVHKTGCHWRMLLTPIGHAHTMYGSFRRWRRAGVWARGMDTLRPWEGQSQGRLPAPSAGCTESQSSKTATQETEVGFDGHKQIKGCKRPILVDTLGRMVAVVLTAAQTEDRLGVVTVVQRDFASGVKRLRKLWVDGSYHAQWLCDWVRSRKQTHKGDREVVEHSGQGLQVVKHRGKVARTFAWLLKGRRHSRDDEVWTANSEAMIQISMIRLLLKRLA